MQAKQGAATSVLLSSVRIVGCLTIFAGFAVAALGVMAGGGVLAMCIGGGLIVIGIIAAAVNKVS